MAGKLMGAAEPGSPPGGSEPASIRGMVGTPMAANGAAAPTQDGEAEPEAAAPSMMGAPGPVAATPPAQPPPPTVEDLEEGLHKTVYLRNKLAMLLRAQKPVTRKQIMDLSSDLLQKGILSAQRIASELASLPEDQDGIMKWVQSHFQTTDGQVDQLSTLLHQADMPGGFGQPKGPPPGQTLQ